MKLTKLSILTALVLSSPSFVYAASNAVPIGSNLGYGAASNNNTLFSMSNNPAWVSGNLHEENNYGFGLTVGAGVKQAGIDELSNTFDDKVSPILDNMGGGGLSALANATQLQTEMNSLILDIRDNFYLQADLNFSLPVLIARNAIGGLGFEISGLGSVRTEILSSDSPFALNNTYLLANPTASSSDIIDNGLIIQSALYTKTALATEAAITYGNQFYQDQYGQLSVGIRAKLMQAKLFKSVISFADFLKNDGEIDTDTEASDSASNIGLDIGVQWFAENYMAGLTIMNLNSPSFDYNQLGKIGTTPEEIQQGLIENFYSNQIDLNETVTLSPQARLEGTLFSESRNWSLGGSLDLNPANDYVNQQYQWATISAAYATQGGSSWIYYLIPDLRLGYRKNLVGDEISYITPGLSWGPLNLDLGFTSLDDLSGGSDTPDGIMLNLGLEVHF